MTRGAQGAEIRLWVTFEDEVPGHLKVRICGHCYALVPTLDYPTHLRRCRKEET